MVCLRVYNLNMSEKDGWFKEFDPFPRMRRVQRFVGRLFKQMADEPARAIYEPIAIPFEPTDGEAFEAAQEHVLGRLVMQRVISVEDALAYDEVFGGTS